VIHAGTAVSGGELVTAGGRVLAVIGTGSDLSQARIRAYSGVHHVSFPGAQFRGDIARSAEQETMAP
jgi:phosphoribosylamine--glycine ligase